MESVFAYELLGNVQDPAVALTPGGRFTMDARARASWPRISLRAGDVSSSMIGQLRPFDICLRGEANLKCRRKPSLA